MKEKIFKQIFISDSVLERLDKVKISIDINIIDIEKKYPFNFFKSLNYVLDGQINNYFSCYSYKDILSIGLLVGSISSF